MRFFTRVKEKILAKVFVLSKHSSFRDEEETRIAIFGDLLRRVENHVSLSLEAIKTV